MLEINKTTLGNSYELIKDMPDKSVDCIYTDIPYLYDSGSKGKSALSQRIGNMKDAIVENKIYDGLNYDILDDFVRVLRKINIFIWCSKLQINDIMTYFLDKGAFFEILVWCKTNPTPATNNSWLPDLEYCLYFREQGVKLNNGYEHKQKWYLSPLNISDKSLYEHITIKPLDLVKKHLSHTTQPNDIIFDPFMGSGTTGVASKELGRRFIGIEIAEKWCKISNDRVNGINAHGQYEMFGEVNGIT